MREDPEFAANVSRKVSEAKKIEHAEGRASNIQDNFSWLGKKHTKETKEKMSATHKRNKHQQHSTNSQYGTMWITDGIYNKKIKRDRSIPDGWNKGRTM